MTGHPPLLVLELQLIGEPVGSARQEHIAGCSECAARLAGLRAEDEAYRRSPRARQLAARLSDPPPRRVGLRRWLLVFLVPSATAAAFAALVWPTFRHSAATDLRAKGTPRAVELSLIVRRGGLLEPWDGRPLHEGDWLQLVASRGQPRQLAAFAIQGTEVTRVFPETGITSAAVPPGTDVPLGPSLRLDGHDVAVLIFTASEPFAIAPIESALRAGGEAPFSGERERIQCPGERGP